MDCRGQISFRSDLQLQSQTMCVWLQLWFDVLCGCQSKKWLVWQQKLLEGSGLWLSVVSLSTAKMVISLKYEQASWLPQASLSGKSGINTLGSVRTNERTINQTNKQTKPVSHCLLLKLSSSSVSGKNTSPPSSSLCLDFFRFILNGSRNPFFVFGAIGRASPGRVAESRGLTGPGLGSWFFDSSVGLLGAPSFWEPCLDSLLSFPGGFILNKPFIFNVPDLLMVRVGQVPVHKV